MIEKISIDGQDVWVSVEAEEGNPEVIPTEYFIAYYSLEMPDINPGKVFKAEDGNPKRFLSPVEAVEYAVEKLPVILG